MPRRSFIAALLIAVSILAFAPFWGHLGLIRNVQAATTNFTLYANYNGWNYSQVSGLNPTITVTQGDTISFKFFRESTDIAMQHVFLLDVDNSSITNDCPNSGPDICSTIITSTQSPSIAPFTVSFPAGSYMYYCIYHSPLHMTGKFVVKAPTTPDFTITANPTAIGPLNARASATSTITVAPTNGFSGTVTLSAAPSSGLNASILPSSISGGSGTATLSVNSTVPGSYSVTVTGMGSPGTRSATVTVTVVMPDFGIALSSSSLTVAPGSSGSVMVTLTSLNGFSGTVSLSPTLSSAGPQVTFSPASLAVSPSGPASSTVSVSAASSGAYSNPVPQGSYVVTVTGTSGSLTHSTALSLTIGSPSSVGGLPSSVVIGGGIAAVIVVVSATVYAFRKRTRTKT